MVEEIITKLFDSTEKRLTDILKYYQGYGKKIEKQDKYYSQHSHIILLTIKEIEYLLEKTQPEKNPENKIPQYNLKTKKLYTIKLPQKEFNANDISLFQTNIKAIQNKLRDMLEIKDMKKLYNVSTIENISNPNENDGNFLKILENVYNCNFHKFFIDEYIHDLIKLKMDRENIYTNKVLSKLKMAKYIIQILLCLKIFIKYNTEEKQPLTSEEKKECSKIAFNDEFVLSNFLLFEGEKKEEGIQSFLIEDNTIAIEELTLLYHELLNIIKQIEDNLNKK